MAIPFEPKERYYTEDLLEIVHLLRQPDGCPWDREQTHASIRNNFLEEVYEAVDAIDRQDSENLREELGDVLLQIALHAEMEKEKLPYTIEREWWYLPYHGGTGKVGRFGPWAGCITAEFLGY